MDGCCGGMRVVAGRLARELGGGHAACCLAFLTAVVRSSKVNQYHHTSILRLEDVNSKEETEFYLGKRAAFIYKVSFAVHAKRPRFVLSRTPGPDAVLTPRPCLRPTSGLPCRPRP